MNHLFNLKCCLRQRFRLFKSTIRCLGLTINGLSTRIKFVFWWICFDGSFHSIAAELKMDVLREREVKDNLERQLLDEQKMRGMYEILTLKQISWI